MAQYHLGLMLAMEENYDEVDTELAKQWFLKAHEQGHFGAMVKYENLMEQ